MKTPKSVDHYISEQGEWIPMLKKLREIVLSADLEEKIKWSMPCYMDRGKNISSIFATKDFVGLWFFQGTLLADPYNFLTNAQEGKTKAMRRWQFFKIEDIEHEKIHEYLFEAIENQRAGREIKPERGKKKPLIIPKELKTALSQSPELMAAFNAFTLGKKREFTDYISEAKRDETKMKRLEKIKPMILAGIAPGDKYRKKN